MKICVTQTRPFIGLIPKNLQRHLDFISQAATFKADIIMFSEVSLTGYEPKLAQQLATSQQDSNLDVLQKMSDEHNITIGAGIPVRGETGILIGMILFQPGKP